MGRGFAVRSYPVAVCLILVGWVSFFVGLLWSGISNQSKLSSTLRAGLRGASGEPQLVSMEPLPMIDGQMCDWKPASASRSLRAALFPQQLAARTTPEPEPGTSVDVDREPARVIRDSYSTYSAVAVNLNTHEVFLQDENLFGIKVFDRTDNTPPTANFTEPKRVISGLNTKLEFNCDLYIDPKTGDIYSVPNDTVDTLVVFPHDAEGNIKPARTLESPHQTFGIAVDEGAQEMYLTVQNGSVIVYRKMASGSEKPLRTLRGPHTELEDPHGIAIDTKNRWMFVSNYGGARGQFNPPSITVYPLKASGDTPPLRIIEGPKTQMNWPSHLALDLDRPELYVANDMGDSILVFRATDQGDVAPIRTIQGPKTGLKNPTDVFLDIQNQELWVSNMGNHSATVYRMTANGDVAPLRTIRSAPVGKTAQMIGNPGAVGYDTKREEILVPN